MAYFYIGRATAALPLLFVAGICQAAEGPAALEVTPARVRAEPGASIEFRLTADSAPHAVLVSPRGGARLITVESGGGIHRITVTLPPDVGPGLHLLHVWTGDAAQPSAVGKAVILAGSVVLDFFLPAYLDETDRASDLAAYLDDFESLGGNALIAHALITPERAYFPSAIARTPPGRESPDDIVRRLLDEADRRGIAVFLSVSWDMTHAARYQERMAQIESIMRELYGLYARHPSLAGFYSYQEGSGTYYVPYVRKFSAAVKALNPGLLSACAPFVDDPLLAGYLSTVETLDVLIFQAQVMASYRTDNRKRYPLRRARDFGALGIGAKRLQDKIALTHVELFGYLETRPVPDVVATTADNIFGQIASVATLPGADGIALFAYHPHIWRARQHPFVQRSRAAVARGLDVFRRVQRALDGHRNPLAVYVPYSDWVVERWTLSLLPAFDAFRQAGIPVDILPYAPPIEESEYPYFPFHMNPDVLDRLLANRRVLVLPDVSGFQQTDSDLIDAFVRRGGVVVAFGPQIPMGRSYERDELFGGRETEHESPRGPIVARGTNAHESCQVDASPSRTWQATTAKALASFEDGSPAVLANRYGAGLAVAVLPSASALAVHCPRLLRGALDEALAHAGHTRHADVDGLNSASDLAIAPTADGMFVALVNHDPQPRPVTIRARDGAGMWVDAATGATLAGAGEEPLHVELPAHSVCLLEWRRTEATR